MEIQRLLAPIMVAEWKIISFTEGEQLLVNDWGFMPVGPFAGMYVPLGRDHVLQLIPRTSRLIAVLRDGNWLPNLSTTKIDKSHRETFNQAIGHNAKRFVFGANRELVQKYLYREEEFLSLLEPSDLGFITGTHAIVHEFMWHYFVSALKNGISENMEPQDFDFDFKGLKEGWVPPIIFPTNLPNYPAGLRRQGDFLAAYLYQTEVKAVPYKKENPNPE